MRRLFRVFFVLLLAGAGAVFVLGTVFLQDAPAVAAMAPPAPEDVRAARGFYHQVRAATNGEPGAPETVTLSAGALQSVLRLGTRLVRDYRAETEVADDLVRMTAALPVPWIGGTRWLNLRAAVAPFEERFALQHVQLGGREIPPDLALQLARLGGNLVLGSGAGDTLFDAPAAMAIDGDRMIFALRLDRDGRGDVIQGVFGALRGGAMPGADRVDHYYVLLRDALDAGTVPDRGSVLPLLTFTLAAAHADSTDASAADEFTAAIFALTKACGANDFHLVVGSMAETPSERARSWRTDCLQLELAGRIDLRRHFLTAAAIQTASNRGFAVSMGEFKELHDTLMAGGYDFTDITANNSGIRMADLFLSRPRADWPALLERMQTEADILPDLQGIPDRMSRSRFEERFGEVDSPAYQAMMDEIEARIDRTALHATTEAGGG